MASETIVAVSTPAGRGGIGIVRIAGPAAADILLRICAVEPAPRRATFVHFSDADGTLLDSGLALYFPAPASYTGDPMVELHAHGNPVVLQQLVQRACALGARAARAGEFTERAFRNGKLDLTQAEAVADVIASQSVRALRSATRTLRGEFAAEVSALIGAVQGARAELEASIDFADEVHAADLVARQQHSLRALRTALAALLKRAGRGMRLSEGANIAIVGAPNVGKSSLLNRLVDDERAIVSAEPGTTRDTIERDLVINGIPVRLVDTAGLRASTDALERAGIARSHRALDTADLVLLVTDSPQPIEADALWQSLDVSTPPAVPHLVVHNKIDLHLEVLRNAASSSDCVYVSALHGDGIESLAATIAAALGVSDEQENEFTAHTRHIDALRRADGALAQIDDQLLANAPELAAEHYRAATFALETISGQYSSEDLLGDIFARFCIGK